MVFAGLVGLSLLVATMTLFRGSDAPSTRADPQPTPSAPSGPGFATPPKPEEVDSAWISQSPAPTIAVGGEATLTFTFRNVGKVAWTRGTASEASLMFTGDDRLFDPRMAVDWPLPSRPAIQAEANVAPGEPATFTFKVRGIARGTYRIDVRPVIVTVGWLRNEGVYNEVTVR